MSIGLKQSVKQSQQLSLSPQLQQSIKILSLGRLELEEFVQKELQENPCLEEFRRKQAEAREKLPSRLQRERVTFNRGTGAATMVGEDEGSLRYAASLHNTLNQSLEDQLQTMELPEEKLSQVLILLQSINESGFLEESLETIAARESWTAEESEDYLRSIQSCDPAGVGARDLRECLLIQLKRMDPLPELAIQILESLWKEFQKQDVSAIAKKLGASTDVIGEELEFIREHCDPKPARQYGDSFQQIIIPDVIVYHEDDTWSVALYEEGMPQLRVVQEYQRMFEKLQEQRSKTDEDKKLKEFVNTNVKGAQVLIQAIQDRNKTLLRVADAILRRQLEFFQKGTKFLKPMTMKTIAEELGVHESTISRATSQKYLYSAMGLFELKYFFSSGMSTEGGGETSNEVLRAWIKEMIDAEDPQRPLSDQSIAERIHKERGVEIARRTIAKYREQLGILATSLRKKRF